MKSYLKPNLDTLEKVNPMLAGLIRNAWDDCQYLDIKDNSEGTFKNLFIKFPNKVLSAYGIEKQKESIEAEAKKFGLFKDGGTIVIGMGLGHLVNEICKLKEKEHIVIVVETIPYLIQKSFEIYNFSEWIANGTLLFACPNEVELEMVLGMVESRCVIRDWNIVMENYTAYLSDYYSKITILTTDLINQIRCNTGTVMGNGKLIAQNDIKNLPYIISSWGISKFDQMFKDKPAVIVSTGPSLRKNIHLLKQHKGKVVIICVAQALRILLAYDIVPDFACTVDFGEVNYEHFKGLMDCGVPLIVLNRSYYKILQEWKGPKIICTNPANPEEKSLMNRVSQYGFVEQGGSVSHFAVGAAIRLGCNPIMLIGQDLAYEKDLSHNPNADASGVVQIDQSSGMIKWNVNDPKSILKDTECIMGVVQDVPGYLESTVQTNIGLLSFITSFKHIFETYKDKTFVNCTEGGANLPGAKNMVLRDALKKYTEHCIKKAHLLPAMQATPDIEHICEELIELADKDIENLRLIIKHSKDAIAHVEQAVRFYNAKRKLHRYLDKNFESSTKAQELTKKNELMNIAIYYASRQIYNRELYVEGSFEHIKKDKKDFMTRVARNRLILDAAIKEATELIEIYKTSRDLLSYISDYGDDKYVLSHTKVQDGRVILLAPDEVEEERKVVPYDLDDAEKYFAKGNFSYPLLESRKALSYLKEINCDDKQLVKRITDIQKRAIEMRKEAIDWAEKNFTQSKIRERLKVKELVEESIRLGKKKEFEKGFDLLKQAHLVLPDDEMVLWGLASFNLFMKNFDESIKFYRALIERYPSNYRYKYEMGNVLLNLDPEEGIKQITEVMHKTEEFDHFFRNIGKYYFLKNDFYRAAQNFQTYIEKYPADYEMLRCLADCYYQLEDKENWDKTWDKISGLTTDKRPEWEYPEKEEKKPGPDSIKAEKSIDKKEKSEKDRFELLEREGKQ